MSDMRRGRALMPGQKNAFPIEGLSEEDIHEARAIVEGFLRKRGVKNPISDANSLVSCAIEAVKMDKRGNKSEWFNAPGLPADTPKAILLKRLTISCGRGFKQYLSGTPTVSNTPSRRKIKNKPGTKSAESPDTALNMITEHDLAEMRKKKAEYIKEFGFSASSDLSLLDRLVRIEVVVAKWETALITGLGVDSRTADSIKKLTDTMVNLQKTLGITAEQRNKVKAQSKEGTVAELFQKYQDTKREWPEIEQKFLLQELHMLLNKYNRIKEDGNREITGPEFKRLSRGISVNDAYALLKRSNPDSFGSDTV